MEHMLEYMDHHSQTSPSVSSRQMPYDYLKTAALTSSTYVRLERLELRHLSPNKTAPPCIMNVSADASTTRTLLLSGRL